MMEGAAEEPAAASLFFLVAEAKAVLHCKLKADGVATPGMRKVTPIRIAMAPAAVVVAVRFCSPVRRPVLTSAAVPAE
jgi:hypothetical protein